MLMSAQPWTFHKRFSGSVLVLDTVPLGFFSFLFSDGGVSLSLCYRPFALGIKLHGPHKINQFSVHDSPPPPPKWRGCSPRPGAQCGNDPQVKGRLASSSIKGKDCNCTMRRLCEEKWEPAVTKIYCIEKTSNFFFQKNGAMPLTFFFFTPNEYYF